ncbi:MAG: metal transporter [Bacteroidetes bacterium]|nr:metal transporter [Bacteroidota bacterium]
MHTIVDKIPRWLLAVLPLVLLGGVLWLFVQFAPLHTLIGDLPPIEELTIERAELRPEGIILHVVNGGPDPVTIAQVQVDEAYWSFTMEPSSQTLARLSRAKVQIPYPWVEGDLHVVRLVTSTGVTFDHVIEVATMTPQADAYHWFIFALIGFFVGIVPVGLGLMWFPLLKQLSSNGLRFILALTIGLLIFLLIDTVLEGLEVAATTPEVFHAVPLIFFAGMLSFLALIAVGGRRSVKDRSTPAGRFWIATVIAIGIGLHNLGEGMAIGSATALGEAALGSFLVIGFAIHNITEGVGIGAPMATDQPSLRRLIGLALLAGSPAILGVWIGGFSYVPLLAVVFLAIGAGAILQVIYEVGRLLIAGEADEEGTLLGAVSWVNIGGFTTGLAIMYATALLVA